MENDENYPVPFGADPSPDDYRTVTSDLLAGATPPTDSLSCSLKEKHAVPLDYDHVNDLCNQRKLGICTMCAVRMAAEQHFKDGVRLSEYWGYIIQKLLVDGNLYEGSSALSSLKCANKYGIPSKEMEEKYPLKVDGTYKEFIADLQEKYPTVPEEIFTDAAKHKIPGYYKVNLDPVSIAKELQENRLIVIRMVAGENFYTDKNGRYTRDGDKLFPLRIPEKPESGHLLAANAHDGLTVAQYIDGPNSWSRTWGNNGYFDFQFETQYPKYFTEAWAIESIPGEIIHHVKSLPAWTRDLYFSMTGEDVQWLQQYLNEKGYILASKGAGSPGKETQYFGKLTRAALARFQAENGIRPAAGYFGPITRDFIRSNG